MLSANLVNRSRILFAIFMTALFISLSTMYGPTLNGSNIADSDVPALAAGGRPGISGT